MDKMDAMLDVLVPCDEHNQEKCELFYLDAELSTCDGCGMRICRHCESTCACGMPVGWSGGELTDEEVDAAQRLME
jgi:hypothetical protein